MKRILISLLLLVLVTSCAHNKIRLVKQPKQEIVIVDEYESSSEDNAEVPVSKKTTRSSKQSRKETVDEELEDEVLNSSNWNTPEPTDTTGPIVLEPSKEGIEDIAEIAEDEARKAEKHMRWTIPSLLLLATVLLSFVPISLFIVGRIHLVRAKKSRYITQKGEQYLEMAKNNQKIIFTILIVVAAIAFLGVIIFWGH